MMLDINPEIVCEIIQRAREFQAKEGVSFPEVADMPSYDYDFSQILADHKDDLTYQEVRTSINKLEPDQQITLVALMYLGRGDYELSEWTSAVNAAREGWTNHTAEYLLSKPQLPEYLEEGLALFGCACDQ